MKNKSGEGFLCFGACENEGKELGEANHSRGCRAEREQRHVRKVKGRGKGRRSFKPTRGGESARSVRGNVLKPEPKMRAPAELALDEAWRGKTGKRQEGQGWKRRKYGKGGATHHSDGLAKDKDIWQLKMLEGSRCYP